MTLGGPLLVAAGGAFVAASPDGDPLIAMDLPAMGFRLLKSAAGWAWVVAILGLAGSRGARPGTPRPSAPVRRWASRSTTLCRPSTCSTRWPDTSSA